MKRSLLLLPLMLAGCSSRDPDEAKGVPPAFGAAYVNSLAPAGCTDFRRRAVGSARSEVARLDQLLAEADRKGVGPGRQELRRSWEKVNGTADMACFPERIGAELKSANARLERALKDID